MTQMPTTARCNSKAYPLQPRAYATEKLDQAPNFYNADALLPLCSRREKIWDHCAGFVIVEEAGGKVTDGSGRRLDFSQGKYLTLDKGIIAAPPRVHAALLAAVSTVSSKQQ